MTAAPDSRDDLTHAFMQWELARRRAQEAHDRLAVVITPPHRAARCELEGMRAHACALEAEADRLLARALALVRRPPDRAG